MRKTIVVAMPIPNASKPKTAKTSTSMNAQGAPGLISSLMVWGAIRVMRLMPIAIRLSKPQAPRNIMVRRARECAD